MPVIKLSKVTIPPPSKPKAPVSDPLPGAPVPPPPAADPAPLPDTGADTPVESPVEVEVPAGEIENPTVGTFAAAAKRPAPEDAGVDVGIPSELVDKLWRAVDVVPGLTIETALTIALQQFLATIPDDYERE